MTLVRRTVVLAGFAALGVLASAGCANGDDAPAARMDSTPRADSVPTTSGTSTPAVAASATPSAPAATPAAATPAGSPAASGVSVRTGVFTSEQAARGQEVYMNSCAQCHTMSQHSGTAFAAAWDTRRLFDLYEIVHNTMPLDNPGGLSEQEYIDVIAWMLQLNGVPPGKAALRVDPGALKALRIDVKPRPGQ